MTYCCENARRAYELMGDAKNKLDWDSGGIGVGGFIAGVFTLNNSTAIKLANHLKEAESRMTDAYNILCNARNAINDCSCGSEKSHWKSEANRLLNNYNNLSGNSTSNFNNLKDRLEDLARNSVSKDRAEELVKRYEELWEEHKKNIEDYNRLARNSVSKETFNEIKSKWEKDVKDYNELFGEHKTLAERAKNLQDKYNELVDRFNDKNNDYQEMSEKYDEMRKKLENEKVRNANDRTNQAEVRSEMRDSNTKLQERLESKSAEVIRITKELENSKEELSLVRVEKDNWIMKLENKLDEKNFIHNQEMKELDNQLTTLRLESGEKDSKLREKEGELERKNEEIERLKKRTGLSREELLTEKLGSAKRNLDLFSSQLEINLEQIHGLIKYHERLFIARKNQNRANIDIHEENIARVKQEFSDQGINIINVQEICQKCERIAEFSWELEQAQQYQAQQEQPANNF